MMIDKKSDYVVAIDVGTTKTVALLGKRSDNNKIEVLGFVRADSKGVRRGEVLNPEEVSTVIRYIINELQTLTGFKFSEVFVGITGEHIRMVKDRKGFNRPVYDESITVDEIEKLKNEAGNIALGEGKKILHILPQSYIVDNEMDISNPVGMFGRRIEANFDIVVASMDSIKRIEKTFSIANLQIRDLILQPLASAVAVLDDEELEGGVALIDIGGGTTDIAVFYNRKLRHSAVFPYGGNVITKDIKECCKINEQQAEELKVQFGAALSDAVDENKDVLIPVHKRKPKEVSIRNLAGIIQARMEEIIEGVMFEIENSGYAHKLCYGIVLTGGGAKLNFIDDLFSLRTGMDVRIGLPDTHLTGDSEKINDPCFATGVGLLIKGFEYKNENCEEPDFEEPEVDNIIKTVEPVNPVKPAKTRENKGIEKTLKTTIGKAKKALKIYFEDTEVEKSLMD